MSKTTAAVIAWRWLSGHALDGRYRTNATWTMPSRGDKPVIGHRPATPSAGTTCPGCTARGIRSGSTLAFLAAAYGLAVAFWLTASLLAALRPRRLRCHLGRMAAVPRIPRWRHHRRRGPAPASRADPGPRRPAALEIEP